jgi:GGDEF domain-containing protein
MRVSATSHPRFERERRARLLDPLTGLADRTLFLEQLARALERGGIGLAVSASTLTASSSSTTASGTRPATGC